MPRNHVRFVTPALLVAAVLAQLGALHAAQPDGAKVTVTVSDATFPVSQNNRRKPNWSPQTAAKLTGKKQYTTPKVTLANRFLRLEVLPEFGGRLIRATYLPQREGDKPVELFWVNDRLDDGVSWSMGGGRWSFPFWEHGRHFDETAGYVIDRAQDGTVTLAMDMRFGEFLTPAETKRYGRATNLRLVQTIRLAPGEARFRWVGRVENPLPIRHGFKLWWLLRQPAEAGLQAILPAGWVTGHGGGKLRAWDQDTEVRTLQTSLFAVGIRHPFAGWYSPDRQINVLRIQNPMTAPGAKVVLYKPSQRGYVEMWGGNHEVFEETGRLLPALGAYQIPVTVLPATGLGGKADFANEQIALRAIRGENGWTLKLWSPVNREGLKIVAQAVEPDAAGQTWTARTGVDVGPGQCVTKTLQTPAGAGRIRLKITDADGLKLLHETFPLEYGPKPEEHFAFVMDAIRANGKIDKSLYAEAMDLVGEHQYTLGRAAGQHEKALKASDDPTALLDAARRLMRVRKNAPEVKSGLSKVLAKQPQNEHARLYLAMWHLEAGQADQADAHLAKAGPLPGARYLRALRAVAKNDPKTALAELDAALQAIKFDTFYGPDDPSRLLLQEGAYVGNTQPSLLKAIVLDKLDRDAQAKELLAKILADDPALIEARILAGDDQAVKTLTENNPSGRKAAQQNLENLRAGRWAGIGRP